MLDASIEARPPLTGRRILVVEDEFLVANELVETLRREGADVIGAAPSVRSALAYIHATPALDAAVIDVNLAGEVAYPVVDAMIERGRPFVFATVCQPEELPQKYRGAPRCAKPLQPSMLVRELHEAMTSVIGSAAGGAVNHHLAAADDESAVASLEEELTEWIHSIATQGDITAYSAVFLAVAPKIKRYMLDSGASHKVAEDLAQEALLRIWREASEFGTSQTAKSWFFTIARDLKVEWIG